MLKAQKRKLFRLWYIQDNLDGTGNIVVKFPHRRDDFTIRDLDIDDVKKLVLEHNRLKLYCTKIERELAKYDESDEGREIRELLEQKIKLEEQVNANKNI